MATPRAALMACSHHHAPWRLPLTFGLWLAAGCLAALDAVEIPGASQLGKRLTGITAAPSAGEVADVAQGLPQSAASASNVLSEGAIVTLNEALAKATLARRPCLPSEDLWNDGHLPHVLLEPWFQQSDERQVGPNSPVSPANLLLRDKANIQTVPMTHLLPQVIRPPFLYLPTEVTDGADPKNPKDPLSYDSPHFRIICPRPANAKQTIPAQKIIEKLEDSLVIMRMMPVYFAKAQVRDSPFKLTLRLEHGGAAANTSCTVDGETVTIRASSSDPNQYEAAYVAGLVNYLLDPMLVHPVIKAGLEEILIRISPPNAGVNPLKAGTNSQQAAVIPPREKTTAAERSAVREDQRNAEKLARELRGSGFTAPQQRTYYFDNIKNIILPLVPADRRDYTSSVTSMLKQITPHVEYQESYSAGVMANSTNRNVSAIITCYFLFEDNDGDPVHLQNYFTSLQMLGCTQLAHARLLYGRSVKSLTSDICRWASK